MHTMQIKTLINRIDEDILKEEGLLHLTANEPYLSELAKKYLSNRLGDRYYMGFCCCIFNVMPEIKMEKPI